MTSDKTTHQFWAGGGAAYETGLRGEIARLKAILQESESEDEKQVIAEELERAKQQLDDVRKNGGSMLF